MKGLLGLYLLATVVVLASLGGLLLLAIATPMMLLTGVSGVSIAIVLLVTLGSGIFINTRLEQILVSEKNQSIDWYWFDRTD